MVDKENFRKWYLFSVALTGAAVTMLFVYRMPFSLLGSKFAAFVLITLIVGSQISIKIPGGRGQIAVSDTFIFLAILLFGVEAAVVLAAAEAFCSSVRFSRKASVLFFNAGVMALATYVSASTFYAAFPGANLRDGFSPNLFVGLCVMPL